MSDRPALDDVPLGGLLDRLLRLLISPERRDEFLGDLVEEVNLRFARGSPGDRALWLWRETLRSAPTLIGWRLRHLVVRNSTIGSHPPSALLASTRGHRGWPASLAVSLSAHALILFAAAGWVLSRVEEIEPPRFLDFSAAILPELAADEPPAPGPIGSASRALTQARPLRLRLARRPVSPAPSPAPPTAPIAAPSLPAPASPNGSLPPGAPSGNPALLGQDPGSSGTGSSRAERRIWLPPRVGEKRCLSCPAPQLPHPYARLGLGREMLVKTCVSTHGSVSSVQVLNGFDGAVNARVIETIRGWRLAPYSLDGHAVPFCYETRFRFTTH
jgi:Gram-negative bacterial TonB protein C-terminal